MIDFFLSVLASVTATAFAALVRWVTALIASCLKARRAKHKHHR